MCLVTGVFGDCSCPVRVPTCQDGVRNGNETDVDCGGTCRVCAVGLACSMNTDCASSMCVAGVCAVPDSSTGPGTQDAGSSSPEAAPAPSCLDGVRNGFETDVDCGGVDCPNCGPGRSCQVPADCVTSVCFPSHVCGTAECTDGMQNGLETDVDCGGSCAPCGVGRACLVGLDCTSSVCVAQTCLPPTCSDAVKNGTESDVDCGGACPACPAGRACLVDADCVQNQCTANVCASP